MDDLYQSVYEHAISNNWKWRFNGELKRPSYEDVCMLVDRMIEQVEKSPTPISIESGGILVKRTDEYVDVYIHAGGKK